MNRISKNPTEFAYVKRDKKTIEQLEKQEIPKYLENEELALLLDTAAKNGLEIGITSFLLQECVWVN